MNLPHIHLLLNHWPIIGTFIALALFVVALTTRKNEIKQVSFVLLALLALVGNSCLSEWECGRRCDEENRDSGNVRAFGRSA